MNITVHTLGSSKLFRDVGHVTRTENGFHLWQRDPRFEMGFTNRHREMAFFPYSSVVYVEFGYSDAL